jgi:hypothetical protein
LIVQPPSPPPPAKVFSPFFLLFLQTPSTLPFTQKPNNHSTSHVF